MQEGYGDGYVRIGLFTSRLEASLKPTLFNIDMP